MNRKDPTGHDFWCPLFWASQLKCESPMCVCFVGPLLIMTAKRPLLSGRLTWDLKGGPLTRIVIFETLLRFSVSFPERTDPVWPCRPRLQTSEVRSAADGQEVSQ